MLFNLFLEVSQILTIRIQIGKNYWDLETSRKSQKKIFLQIHLILRQLKPTNCLHHLLHILLAFLSSSYCSKHWSFLQKIISLESQKSEQRRNKNRPNCLHHLVHLLLAVLIRHIAGNIGHFCKKLISLQGRAQKRNKNRPLSSKNFNKINKV